MKASDLELVGVKRIELTIAELYNEMQNLIDNNKYLHREYYNIKQYIERKRYTFTVDEVMDEFRNYYMEDKNVSYTISDVIGCQYRNIRTLYDNGY